MALETSYTEVLVVRALRQLLLVSLGVAGCARPTAPVVDPVSPQPYASATLGRPTGTAEPETTPLGAGTTLAEIEAELLAIGFVLRFDIEAEGLVAARLTGELRSRGDAIMLRASGSFAGEPVELTLEGDGQRLTGSSGTARMELPQPPALAEAVVIGLTRMGLLHNLAVLVHARPPDHADEGVREWVQTEQVEWTARVGPTEPRAAARHEQAEPISFAIEVSGQHVGDATLWCDVAARLPFERHQVVRFPEGELRVRESYEIEWSRASD